MQKAILVYVAVSSVIFFGLLFANIADPRMSDSLLHWNESTWYEKAISINFALSIVVAAIALHFQPAEENRQGWLSRFRH
ncbi:MAG: hypothetical protein QNJ40_14525 [Xanthomonadales bacterium]|nr:hypothetical protein [Xanthomonadales bacterium]